MFSRRVKERITSYVSLDGTQKTSKRTSKMYKLFLLDDLAIKIKNPAFGNFIPDAGFFAVYFGITFFE